MKIRIALCGAALLLVACIPVLLGCGSGKFFIPPCQGSNCGGGGGGSTTYSSYAYVANQTAGTVTLIPLPTGTFTSLTGTSYALGTTPSAVAATPKGTFLYVAVGNSIATYTIGVNGVLTLSTNSSPQTFLPTSMTIDPSGNWLFVVSSSSNALFQYQINTSTGALTQVGQGIGLAKGNPTQIYVTPNDQNVYVGLGSGGMDSFVFNSTTGALSNQLHLTPLGSAGQADNSIAADNNSAFLFVGEAGSGIRVFTIGSGGSLKEISGSPFTSQLGPSSIVVDPTNTYVYVANKGSNVISGYTLAASGSLTPLPDSPTTSTGTVPIAMSLDSTGQYLLVVNNGGSPDLQVFSFDSTTGGKLDLVTSGSTGSDPTGPVSLSVVP